MPEIVAVDRLVKRYGARDAVRGVSFRIAEGKIIGLLGPNGPGKSTILQILAGYLQPTAGRLPADPAATIPITVRKRRFPALIATIFRTVNLESIMRETPGYLAVNR